MPHYKVNMMGGFRVADLELVLDEGKVYEFSDDEIRRSKGLTAAKRDRWMVETDADGKPLKRASKPRRKPAASVSEITVLDADDEEEKLGQVLDDEMETHFDDEFADAVANDGVATPFGDKGGGTKKKKSGGRTRKPRKPRKPVGRGLVAE